MNKNEIKIKLTEFYKVKRTHMHNGMIDRMNYYLQNHSKETFRISKTFDEGHVEHSYHGETMYLKLEHGYLEASIDIDPIDKAIYILDIFYNDNETDKVLYSCDELVYEESINIFEVLGEVAKGIR